MEVLADLTVVDGGHVEEEEESDEEEDDGGQTDPDEHDLLPPVVLAAAEGDEGQEGVAEQEAGDEAEQVGVVVDPRQEASQEEDRRDAYQLEDGHLGIAERRPLVNHLDHAAGQKAKMGSGRTDLKMTRILEQIDHFYNSISVLTSALYGTKMAEARLPTMPEPR